MRLRAKAMQIGGAFVLGLSVGLALAARLGRTQVRA